MAIEYVGGATTSKVGATSGTSTLALNSGLTGGISSSAQSGDFVIAMFATGSTVDRTLSITDGTNNYTLIGTELYASDTYDINLRVAYKFITSDTAVTFGPTGSTSDAGAMGVAVFRGVNVATPIDVTTTTATNVNLDDPNPPAITPVTRGAYIVCVGATAHADGIMNYSAPADLINFLSQASDDTNDVTLGFGHKADWTSGPFDPAIWTFASARAFDDSWAAITMALRPAFSLVYNPAPLNPYLVR